MSSSIWKRPPDGISLPEQALHVWRIRVEDMTSRVGEFSSLLSRDEQRRAAAFHFDIHRERFTLFRASLRILLARYVDIPPAEIAFAYGAHDKPALVQRQRSGGIEFNLTHSEGLGVLAVTRNRRVGVDVERIRSELDINQLARQVFSQHEIAELGDLPPEQRMLGFFRGWTRKEAYVKAIGWGLSAPLKEISVSLASAESARLLETDGTDSPHRWTMYDFAVDPGFVAAVVVEGRVFATEFWRFQPSTIDDIARP